MKTYYKTTLHLILFFLFINSSTSLSNNIKKTKRITIGIRSLDDNSSESTEQAAQSENASSSDTTDVVSSDSSDSTGSSDTTVVVSSDSSDSTGVVSSDSSSSSSTSVITSSTIEETDSSGNSTINYQKKSSSGLSTGAICGIVIPCCAALIGVAAAAALCKGGTPTAPVFTPSIPPMNYIDTSLDKFNVVQQVPIQQPVQIIEPPPQPIIQHQIIEPEPIRPIIRPNYPVNAKLEPPVVNRAFQPMYPSHQHPITTGKQIKMMPVQEVKMVPVQQVEMVPVHEVVPTQELLPVQGIVPTHEIVGAPQVVPLQNIVVPMQDIVPLNQGVSEIPQVSIIPGINENSQGAIGSINQMLPLDSETLPNQIIS